MNKTLSKIAFVALAFLCLSGPSLLAWGRKGHQIIVAIAQRHLTPEAAQNIAQFIPYDLKEDAKWMDDHRKGEWEFTNPWHVFFVDENHNYDPLPPRGDAIKAIRDACWRLSDRSDMSDSLVVLNIRMLIHFIGDMHCPVHVLVPGRTEKYCSSFYGKEFYPTVGVLVPVRFEGREEVSYHSFFDHVPNHAYDGTPDEIAAQFDQLRKKEVRTITRGEMVEVNGRKDFGPALSRWAKECADMATEIWKYNPEIVPDLNPATQEMAKPLVEKYMLEAGYRLARLLNAVFADGK